MLIGSSHSWKSVFQAELAAEHVAARQAVEPPCLGGVEAELALGDQCVGDRDAAQVDVGDVAGEQFGEQRFIAAVFEFVLDRGEVGVVTDAVGGDGEHDEAAAFQ